MAKFIKKQADVLQTVSIFSMCAEDASRFSNDMYAKRYMREKITNRFKQSGRSMIEMLGVLAIIGVLSVGGITGYTKAMIKSKTNSTIETMLSIASNIQTISLRSKKYSNIAAAAIKMKAIPEKVLSADGKSLGVNAFGGSVDIDAFGKHSFYIAMNGLPREVCVDIATKDFGSALVYAGGKNFSVENVGLSASTNLKIETAKCGINYCLKKMMTPATAANACSCGAAGGCSVALIMF